jgi:hypothetical protein
MQQFNLDFQELVRTNTVPNLMIVRLPRDHTVGTAKGYSSVFSMVADNDYAVGQLVETVSHSPIWMKCAIIVVEDDAQFGGDHVDAHRSFAQVISPYTRPSALDSRFYNTTSALRTIGLILGLPPLSQFDAIAAPMDVFMMFPVNPAPYTAILPAREIIAEVNDGKGFLAEMSKNFNLYDEESEPDKYMNGIMMAERKRRHGY